MQAAQYTSWFLTARMLKHTRHYEKLSYWSILQELSIPARDRLATVFASVIQYQQQHYQT